jgi:hypothetical protein
MTGQPGRLAQLGRLIALLVSNAIKLGGLYVALKTVSGPAPSAVTIGLAAFMMAGAQISEDTILNLVDRMFGTHTEKK